MLANPVSVDSEALTGRLPSSLLRTAKKMLAMFTEREKELGPWNTIRFSLPSVRKARPSQDLISL